MQLLTDAGCYRLAAWGISRLHLHSWSWDDASMARPQRHVPGGDRFHADVGRTWGLGQATREDRIRDLSLDAPAASSTTTARFPPVRRRTARGQETAVWRDPGGDLSAHRCKIFENLLDANAMPSEWTTIWRWPRGCRTMRGVSRCGCRGEAAGLEFTLHAPSYIPSCSTPRTVTCGPYVSRSTTRALSSGKPVWGQRHRPDHAYAASVPRLQDTLAPITPKSCWWPRRQTARTRWPVPGNDMAAKARPVCRRDVVELREFARTELGMDTWSWTWAWAKAQAASATLLRRRGEAVFPGAQGAGGPVQA